MKNNPKAIIVHCSDISQATMPDQLYNIDKYHKEERGFPKSSTGYYVGYHRLITGSNNYQTKLDDDEGAHCNQIMDGVSMNFQSLGVCVGFDGDVEYPSMTHYDLLQKQVWKWQDEYKIPNDKVFFHRHFATWKSCPGGLITDAWLEQLLRRPLTTPSSVRIPTESCTFERGEIEKQKTQIFNLQTLISNIIKLFKK